MRVSCIQMDMLLGKEDYNFKHAQDLIRATVAQEHPDVVVLPETWNVGFFPKEDLVSHCDQDGTRIKKEIGGLAKELNTNIVAGSIGNVKGGKVYNTAFVFDREGNCVYQYDKIHLFTPSGEHEYIQFGQDKCVRFQLDGVNCGLIICYDIRFPELTRSLALQGIDVFFVVSQWPNIRTPHLDILCLARAIENQMFLALCNSCGTAGSVTCGGSSTLIDPWGKCLAHAGSTEEVITADLDLTTIEGIRKSINVFNDRKPALYQLD